MKLVNDDRAVTARLVPPPDHGFAMLAGEVGSWRGPFAVGGGARQQLIARLRPVADRLVARDDVLEVTMFRAILRPPGEGAELLHAKGLRPARYDVVVLIRSTDVSAALALRDDPAYVELAALTAEVSRHTHRIVARSPASLGTVEHAPDHPFLFNYFHATDLETLLRVWEYTAGWFQQKTSLPNSEPMQPIEGESDHYGLVNHASWPNIPTFLPSLLFRPSFRTFVLANFKANDIAAQPIIYRRV